MIVSPSESEAFRALGRSTWRCEDFGVDVMWVARGQTFGIQRKALRDLLASVEDGRLAKEVMQMQSLDAAWLVLETGERGGGQPRELPDGKLAATIGKFGRPWTGKQLRGVLWGLQERGVRVETVKDETECIVRVREIEAWSRKDRHESSAKRGAVKSDVFGKRGNREYGVFVLQSVPGMGVELAGRVYDEFGEVPLRWTVGEKDLMRVKGVGKKMARRMLDVFGEMEEGEPHGMAAE